MKYKKGDVLEDHIGKMVITKIEGKWITINSITKDNKPSNYTKIYMKKQLEKNGYKKNFLCRRVDLNETVCRH